MKYCNWFEHEISSLDDPKLQEVFRKFGLEGLGAYWLLVEFMYKAGGKLLIEDIPEYAFTLRMNEEKLQMLIKCKAFVNNSTHFWTTGVEKRIEKRQDIGTKRSFAVSQRKDRAKQIDEKQIDLIKNVTNVEICSTLVGKKENTIKKEKKEKILLRSPAQQAYDLFLSKYKNITGLEYIANWGKHCKILQQTVKTLNPDEYGRAVDKYFGSRLGQDKKYSFDFFHSSINTWREVNG